jgi:drug/metabolite transporter (DMT)-like permease
MIHMHQPAEHMSLLRLISLTSLAMMAFAGNSLLCRLALKNSAVDAATFTSVRLISGTVVLLLIVSVTRSKPGRLGNWPSAIALFAYASGFSYAYVSLPAATGALLLFGAVQSTMIGHAIWKGARLNKIQLLGLTMATCGLIGMFLPGLSMPPLLGSLLMLGAGIAWGVYSLRAKGMGDPTEVTAGNFLRSVPFALVLSMLMLDRASLNATGLGYAATSGALTSGLGYAIWYRVLPAIRSTSAATVQLSVPVVAAVGGVLFLGESVTLRLILASIAILGGVALTILAKQK